MPSIDTDRDRAMEKMAECIKGAPTVQEALSIVFLNDYHAARALMREIEAFNKQTAKHGARMTALTFVMIALTVAIAMLTFVLAHSTIVGGSGS